MSVQSAEKKLLYLAGLLAAGTLVILLNVAAARYLRLRADITADRRFTIDARAIKELRRLQAPVHVTWYVTEPLPPHYGDLYRETVDRINEMKRYAGDKLVFEYKKLPEKISRERIAELAQKFNVQPVAQAVQEAAKAQVQLVYSTFVITYLDRETQYVRDYRRSGALEYCLMRAIARATRREKPVVVLLKPAMEMSRPQAPYGHPTPRPSPHEEFLREALREDYDLRIITLGPDEPLPENTKCLLVIQPEELSRRQVYEISRYLARGGRAIMALPAVEQDLDVAPDPDSLKIQFKASKASGLAGLLASWGIEIPQRVVCDVNCADFEVRYRRFSALRPMPEVVLLDQKNMAQDSPLTQDVDDLGFPFTSYLAVEEKKAREAGLEVTNLLQTSGRAWLQETGKSYDLVELWQQRNEQARKEAEGEKYRLAVQLTGKFPLLHAGQPVPAWEDEGKTDPKAPKARLAEKERQEGAVTLVASSFWLRWYVLRHFAPPGLRAYPNYYEFSPGWKFFATALELHTLGEGGLVSMKLKGYKNRPARPTSDAEKIVLVAVTCGAVPLLLVVFGIARWMVRAAARRRYRRRVLALEGS